MKIIPAIDLINGNCVRLTKGDYATEKVYHSDPAEVAKQFEYEGFTRLHVVDLDGAKAGKVVNLKTLENICSKTSLKVDFGGGIKTREDLNNVLDAGAYQVTVGSLAVKDPKTLYSWISEFGAGKFILGADVLNGKIAVNGWMEDSGVDLFDFIDDYYELGVHHVLCTDISKDGMLQGTSNELYEQIMNRYPDLHLIASGGVSGLSDVEELILLNMPAVVIGKAIYEGRIDIKELAKLDEKC
ncbi:MAG: 1-(5-phosphoribosyl)-5-[(5-phosphoribosylamino)methylideneamino]imidazole-4-carboxamide isomerase [Bacteroidota bacterium]